jgi:hypothetical protein
MWQGRKKEGDFDDATTLMGEKCGATRGFYNPI